MQDHGVEHSRSREARARDRGRLDRQGNVVFWVTLAAGILIFVLTVIFAIVR